MTWFTATLGPKGQITLPKKIRMALGIVEKGETVGFVLDEKEGSVRLARMEVCPVQDTYSEEDLRKMLKVARGKDRKQFNSAEDFLEHINRL